MIRQITIIAAIIILTCTSLTSKEIDYSDFIESYIRDHISFNVNSPYY